MVNDNFTFFLNIFVDRKTNPTRVQKKSTLEEKNKKIVIETNTLQRVIKNKNTRIEFLLFLLPLRNYKNLKLYLHKYVVYLAQLKNCQPNNLTTL